VNCPKDTASFESTRKHGGCRQYFARKLERDLGFEARPVYAGCVPETVELKGRALVQQTVYERRIQEDPPLVGGIACEREFVGRWTRLGPGRWWCGKPAEPQDEFNDLACEAWVLIGRSTDAEPRTEYTVTRKQIHHFCVNCHSEDKPSNLRVYDKTGHLTDQCFNDVYHYSIDDPLSDDWQVTIWDYALVDEQFDEQVAEEGALISDQIHAAVHEAVQEENWARIEIVKEPLKTRGITALSAVLQHYASHAQGVLWKHLSSRPEYRLTGHPLTDDMVSGDEWRLKDGEFYVSVDYKAATDMLFSSATIQAWETIATVTGMPDMLRVAGRHILTNARLRARTSDGQWHEGVQKNGQLMGCVVSFPLLCVINMAILRAALQIAGVDSPILVNGDDALCKMTKRAYEIWTHLISFTGLRLSVGKNYTSTKFAVINSQMLIPTVRFDGTFHLRRIPYVNYGLLLGQGRVLGRTDEEDSDTGVSTTSHAARLRALLEGHSIASRESLFAKYLELHGKDLRRPWFLPEHYGGHGLPRPSERFSDDDPTVRAVVGYMNSLSHSERLQWQFRLHGKRRLSPAQVLAAKNADLLADGEEDQSSGLTEYFMCPAELAYVENRPPDLRPTDTDLVWSRLVGRARAYYAGRAYPESLDIRQPAKVGKTDPRLRRSTLLLA